LEIREEEILFKIKGNFFEQQLKNNLAEEQKNIFFQKVVSLCYDTRMKNQIQAIFLFNNKIKHLFRLRGRLKKRCDRLVLLFFSRFFG
jgi:hypothetical protein